MIIFIGFVIIIIIVMGYIGYKIFNASPEAEQEVKIEINNAKTPSSDISSNEDNKESSWQDYAKGGKYYTPKSDCKYSEWNNWSQECLSKCNEGNQKQTRTRSILVDAEGDGEPCDAELLEQDEECPCPIDCEVEWSECSQKCGNGTQTGKIIKEPKYGGKECPALSRTCKVKECPINCSVLEWNNECSKLCGSGVRTPKKCNTSDCQGKYGGTTCIGKTISCNLHPCWGGPTHNFIINNPSSGRSLAYWNGTQFINTFTLEPTSSSVKGIQDTVLGNGLCNYRLEGTLKIGGANTWWKDWDCGLMHDPQTGYIVSTDRDGNLKAYLCASDVKTSTYKTWVEGYFAKPSSTPPGNNCKWKIIAY